MRALAQAPDSPADPLDPGAGHDQTVIPLPEPAGDAVETIPASPSELGNPPEVRLLGRTAHRDRAELEAIAWPAGHSPACPSCTHPTTGIEEQYARVRRQREPVIIALAQPCGCLVNEHVVALQAGVSIA